MQILRRRASIEEGTRFVGRHGRCTPAGSMPNKALDDDALALVRELSTLLERRTTRASRAPAPAAAPFVAQELDLDAATSAFQRQHVMRVLDHVGGNRAAAAKALGLSPATFYRYLQRLGLKGWHLDE